MTHLLHSRGDQACCHRIEGWTPVSTKHCFGTEASSLLFPSPCTVDLGLLEKWVSTSEGPREILLMGFHPMFFCICRHFDWFHRCIFKGQLPGLWSETRNLSSDLPGYIQTCTFQIQLRFLVLNKQSLLPTKKVTSNSSILENHLLSLDCKMQKQQIT